jgi:hypothetical protein
MRLKAVTVGIVLLGTALSSAALILGRARGAAWIGQPLELMVQVQTDLGQTDGALCADADVFHGDSRQDSSRIQVVATPSDQPDTVNLKISSTALVDEPVVTVYLRAGCNQKSSRKYVLLADFPNDSAATLSRSAAPVAPQAPLVIPVQTAPLQATPVAAPPDEGGAPPVAAKPQSNNKPRIASNAPAPKEAAKESVKASPKEPPKEAAPKKEVAAKPAETEKPSSAGKPRLRLDPIETLNERVKTLESGTTGTTVKDDLARDGQKMQALQTDLKTLLDQAVKNEASLMAMRERLEKAESDRVPVALVYGLVALVVLCMGALAFLWTRRPRPGAWENPAQSGPSRSGSGKSMPAPLAASHPHGDVHVDLVDMDDESFDRLMGQAEAEKKRAS